MKGGGKGEFRRKDRRGAVVENNRDAPPISFFAGYMNNC